MKFNKKSGALSEQEIVLMKQAIDDKYEKPEQGIPAKDLASGLVPSIVAFGAPQGKEIRIDFGKGLKDFTLTFWGVLEETKASGCEVTVKVHDTIVYYRNLSGETSNVAFGLRFHCSTFGKVWVDGMCWNGETASNKQSYATISNPGANTMDHCYVYIGGTTATGASNIIHGEYEVWGI